MKIKLKSELVKSVMFVVLIVVISIIISFSWMTPVPHPTAAPFAMKVVEADLKVYLGAEINNIYDETPWPDDYVFGEIALDKPLVPGDVLHALLYFQLPGHILSHINVRLIGVPDWLEPLPAQMLLSTSDSVAFLNDRTTASPSLSAPQPATLLSAPTRDDTVIAFQIALPERTSGSAEPTGPTGITAGNTRYEGVWLAVPLLFTDTEEPQDDPMGQEVEIRFGVMAE